MASVLRKITVAAIGVAFPLFLSHGIVFEEVVPALGLIPIFMSTVLGIIVLCRRRRIALAEDGTPMSSRRPDGSFVLFAADTFLSLFHLGIFVATCVVSVNGGWDVDPSSAFLAAWCSFILAIDMCIHAYLAGHFVLCRFSAWVAGFQRRPCDCAHCRQVHGRGVSIMAQAVGATPAGGSPLLGPRDDEMRASNDLESGVESPKGRS